MRYAVNLPDLLYPDRLLMARLLIEPVRGEVVYVNGRRLDEVALELACSEERARAIIDIIRMKFKWLRCYQCKQTGWRRIPRHAPLFNQ